MSRTCCGPPPMFLDIKIQPCTPSMSSILQELRTVLNRGGVDVRLRNVLSHPVGLVTTPIPLAWSPGTSLTTRWWNTALQAVPQQTKGVRTTFLVWSLPSLLSPTCGCSSERIILLLLKKTGTAHGESCTCWHTACSCEDLPSDLLWP